MTGRTPNRCRLLQERLLEAGIKPGQRLPRRQWDQLIVRTFQVGREQARNITADGDLHGYWIRHPHHGQQQGSIELRPTQPSD